MASLLTLQNAIRLGIYVVVLSQVRQLMYPHHQRRRGNAAGSVKYQVLSATPISNLNNEQRAYLRVWRKEGGSSNHKMDDTHGDTSTMKLHNVTDPK